MQRVTPDRPWPLHEIAAVRRLEQRAAAGLPAHTLMQRAGLSVARLALALAPHARRVWIACGPGNNGGDGFEAVLNLAQWGKDVVVTLAGDPATLPADASRPLQGTLASAAQATAAGRGPVIAIDVPSGLGVDTGAGESVRATHTLAL